MEIKLKQVRESIGITQEELAEKAGLSRQTIFNLESGRVVTTSTKTMLKIARALNVSVTDIFLF